MPGMWRPFGAGVVNLLTVESITKQGLVERLAESRHNTILTTVHHNSANNYSQQISRLSQCQHIKFVPHFAPLIQQLQQSSELTLVVGEPDQEIQSAMQPNKTVTLEEICRAYPQKIPLSCRDKTIAEQARQSLTQRIGIQFCGQQKIQFQRVVVLGGQVQMWDQAFQVILDCLPAPVHVPYSIPNESQPYRLSTSDFVRGLKTVHETVSQAIKTHPALNLVELGQLHQFDWMVTHIAPQTQSMGIDRYFFRDEPKATPRDTINITDKLEILL